MEDKFIILTVGSHTGIKGHKECIQAFRKAKIKNSVLVVIGNVPWRGGCYKQCLSSIKKSNFLFFITGKK